MVATSIYSVTMVLWTETAIIVKETVIIVISLDYGSITNAREI